MARPKAAQPMAASAVFIKSRENFLSILQQEEQQPVRAIVVATSGLSTAGQIWGLSSCLNKGRADGRDFVRVVWTPNDSPAIGSRVCV